MQAMALQSAKSKLSKVVISWTYPKGFLGFRLLASQRAHKSLFGHEIFRRSFWKIKAYIFFSEKQVSTPFSILLLQEAAKRINVTRGKK